MTPPRAAQTAQPPRADEPPRAAPLAPSPAGPARPARKRRRWPLVTLAILAAAASAAYVMREEIGAEFAALQARRAADSATAVSPAAPKPPSITVATATTREIAETLVTTGTLVARDEILVGPQIDGLRLESWSVDVGDRVERGQTLATLDRDMLDTQIVQNASNIARAGAAIAQVRAAIAEAEASVVEAEASLQRAVLLKRSGNATEETLTQRQTASRVAAARVEAQKQNLKVAESDKTLVEAQRREIELRLARTDVKAPAAGIVSSRTARVGQIVGMGGEPLFRIVRDGEVELAAEATEARLHSVEVGQGAKIEVAGFPAAIEGRVRLVAPTVDETTRLGLVKITLPAEKGLRPGLFARGLIETARRTGVVVPRSALLFSAEGTRVQVVKDGVVSDRPVRTGLSDAEGVEIAEGIGEGEDVVARAGGFLRDGDRITPVRESGPKQAQAGERG